MVMRATGAGIDVERRLLDTETELRQRGLEPAALVDALAKIKSVREEWNAKPPTAEALEKALAGILGDAGPAGAPRRLIQLDPGEGTPRHTGRGAAVTAAVFGGRVREK